MEVDDSKKARRNRKRFLKRYPNGDSMMTESEVRWSCDSGSCHNNHSLTSYSINYQLVQSPVYTV